MFEFFKLRKLRLYPRRNDRAIELHAATNDSYNPIFWLDENGKFMFGIVAHLYTKSGKLHGHAGFYFADPGGKGTGANGKGRMSKFDMQINKEVPFFSIEDAYFGFKPNKNSRGGGLIWVHPETRIVYEMDIDKAVHLGILKVAPVTYEELITPGEPV